MLKAGKEAGAYGRNIESTEDERKLEALEKAGKLKRVPFKDTGPRWKNWSPPSWRPTPRRLARKTSSPRSRR